MDAADLANENDDVSLTVLGGDAAGVCVREWLSVSLSVSVCVSVAVSVLCLCLCLCLLPDTSHGVDTVRRCHLHSPSGAS